MILVHFKLFKHPVFNNYKMEQNNATNIFSQESSLSDSDDNPPIHLSAICPTFQEDLKPIAKVTKNHSLTSNLSLQKKTSEGYYGDALRQSMKEIQSERSEYVMPKVNDSVLNDIPTQETEETPKKGKGISKWRKVALIARSIHRFQKPIVEGINSAVTSIYNIILITV